MLLVALSVVLAVASLAGIVLLILSGILMTVDGLFYTLILGAMAAIFGLNSLLALRRLRILHAAGAIETSKPATTNVAGSASPAAEASTSTTRPGAAPTARNSESSTPAATMSPTTAAAPTSGTTPATTSGTTSAAPKSATPHAIPVSEAAVPPVAAPAAAAPNPVSPASASGAKAEADKRPQQKARPVEGLTTGSFLIKPDAPLPADVPMEPCGKLMLVDCNGAASLERRLSDAGLVIFFPVGTIEGSGWGTNRKRAVAAALGSVFSSPEAQGRNAIELSRIDAVNVLGMHHVKVIAHVRHIQKAPFVLESADTKGSARTSERQTAFDHRAA